MRQFADAAVVGAQALAPLATRALDKAVAALPTAAAAEGDGFAALALLLRIAATDAPTAEAAGKHLAPSAPLLQDRVLVKLNDAGAHAAVAMAQAALRLALPAATTAAVLHVLAVLAAFAAWPVRRAARAALTAAVTASPALGSAAVASLRELVGQAQQTPDKWAALPAAAKPDVNAAVGAVLRMGAGTPADVATARLLQAVVLCHHALLEAVGSATPWKRYVKRAGLVPADVVAAHARALVDQIVPEDVLVSDDKDGFRAASLRALTAVATLAPGPVVAEALARVNALAQAVDAAELTDFDLAVFRTEPGQLYVDVLSKNKDGNEAAAEQLARRSRGRHTPYSYEDELWEAQVRRELAAKKKEVLAGGGAH